MIILDTNVLSELMRPKPSVSVLAWIAKQPEAELFTTSITEAEIFYGIEVLPKGKRREHLTTAAEAVFTEDFSGRVYSFDSTAARVFSKVASSRRTSGRPVSHADAQIAAIAKTKRAKIASRDVKGFEQCGVDVVDPWNEY
jgi:predicted nucleic acid-binding protein